MRSLLGCIATAVLIVACANQTVLPARSLGTLELHVGHVTQSSRPQAALSDSAATFTPLSFSDFVHVPSATRYLKATFGVVNNTSRTLTNLTLLAYHQRAANIGGTGVKNLVNFVGGASADNARNLLPMHGMTGSSNPSVVNVEADFQAVRADEARLVQNQARASGDIQPDDTVLEYGFVVHSSSGGRSLAPGGEGRVTLTYKLPNNRVNPSYRFVATFALAEFTPIRVTRGLEEPSSNAVARGRAVRASEVVFVGADTDAGSTIRLGNLRIGTSAWLLFDVAYPLKRAPSRRFLVDQNDVPFLIHGDTAWSLIPGLSKPDAESYLEDRRRKGVNTILVNLIEHRYLTDPPNNTDGVPPFTTPEDLSTPNEAYFAHADWVIRKAAEKGIQVLLTPLYLGYGGGGEGWYQAALEGGLAKVRDYGRFVGNRYKDFKNIIWVIGGDYNAPNKDLVRAFVEGIEAFDTNHLMTYHGDPNTSATDEWGGEPWLDINTTYTYGSVWDKTLENYNRSDAMPVFLFESKYENENGVTENGLREQAYEALLGGSMGQVFGNNPMWHFGSGGLFPAPYPWQEALQSQGSKDMAHLWDLFNTLEWFKLQPDQNAAWLVAGAGPSDHAALAQDGSFGLVYSAQGNALSLDLSKLVGPRIRARWYDPTSGVFSSASETLLTNSGTRVFTSSTTNATATPDWVLVLESMP
jgi:hypothetical protein